MSSLLLVEEGTVGGLVKKEFLTLSLVILAPRSSKVGWNQQEEASSLVRFGASHMEAKP